LYRTARTTPLSRAFLVDQARQLGVSRVARNMGISRQTVYRWRRRSSDFDDRSCRPHHSPRRTAPRLEAAVLGLRLELRWGPDQLGPYLGIPASTAYAVLRRFGASRLRTLFPIARPQRGHFRVDAPGYIATDVKSVSGLARGGGRKREMHHSEAGPLARVGWRHLHVAIDLASRLVYAELRSGQGPDDCIAFLAAAVAFFDARGIRVRRVLSDNGNGYKSHAYRAACAALGIRHTRIQPRHPWTNGRVEAFNGTIQRECLYARTFTSDEERALAIWLWIAYYNAERPHTSLGGLSPELWLRARGVTRVFGDRI
jgi:transposase InsO family protein